MTNSHDNHGEPLRQWPWLLAGGIVLLAIGSAGAVFDAAHFFRAYLVAWLLVWGLAMGSLALVMIHHLTGGIWGLAMRRALEAQMRTLPLVALLLLPIVAGLEDIYPWANEDDRLQLHRFQRDYFAAEFVALRWLAYFVLWCSLAWLLSRWSRPADSTSAAWPARYCQNLSGPGLVAYGISLHFAAIDAMMSIEPHFTSTIYGPIVVAGQLLSAFCLALIILALIAAAPPVREVLSVPLLSDLGGLLFTLLIVWAYLIWFQFMLIWMADLRRDNAWYLERSSPGWVALIVVVAMLGFGTPFVALLFRTIKRNLRALALIAALLLMMQGLYMEYQIMPAFAPRSSLLHGIEVLLSLGLGAIYVACVLWLLPQRALVPVYDRNRSHARHLQELQAEDEERQEALHHA